MSHQGIGLTVNIHMIVTPMLHRICRRRQLTRKCSLAAHAKSIWRVRASL